MLNSTTIESPESTMKTEIPCQYQAFQDVFRKQLATELPPHQPWDSAIDLLPGATLPKGKIYTLSIVRAEGHGGIHRRGTQAKVYPSIYFPCHFQFFFVGKKDGGLRPCTEYRTLDAQTIKFRYPLSLVPSSLEQLRGAQIFTKLDLRNANNLVRIQR